MGEFERWLNLKGFILLEGNKNNQLNHSDVIEKAQLYEYIK